MSARDSLIASLSREDFERIRDEVYAEDKAVGLFAGRNGYEQSAEIVARIAAILGSDV